MTVLSLWLPFFADCLLVLTYCSYITVNFAFFQTDTRGNMWGTDAWAVSHKNPLSQVWGCGMLTHAGLVTEICHRHGQTSTTDPVTIIFNAGSQLAIWPVQLEPGRRGKAVLLVGHSHRQSLQLPQLRAGSDSLGPRGGRGDLPEPWWLDAERRLPRHGRGRRGEGKLCAELRKSDPGLRFRRDRRRLGGECVLSFPFARPIIFLKCR